MVMLTGSRFRLVSVTLGEDGVMDVSSACSFWLTLNLIGAYDSGDDLAFSGDWLTAGFQERKLVLIKNLADCLR